MLRRSCRRLVMEGRNYHIRVACLPVLAQDIDPVKFHTTCLPGLYQPVDITASFSKCHKLFNRRIIVSAPVELGSKCLRVPFLVDTGAPSTYLHSIGVEKFVGCGNPIMSHYSIKVGGVELQADSHDLSTGAVAYLNILGMDFLDDAAPNLLTYFTEAFGKYNGGAVTEYLVSDGRGVAFRVTPKHPDVMSLKQAIKEYMTYALPPPYIVVKDPATGKAMGDKDPLHSGIEYLYEVPKL